jgi:hypothetical protein
MQEFWIAARTALALLEPHGGHSVRYAICKRAHAGLLKSKAKLLIVGKQRHENAILPEIFWWAEGQQALEQNWTTGDFETWIEQTSHLRAFGVQFDFAGLREMLPAEAGVAAARQLSVANDSEWVSAKAARRFMYERLGSNPTTAGAELIEQCKLGFVAARAVLAQRGEGTQFTSSDFGQREWDIPQWFWLNFTKAGASVQDWDRAVFSGRGRSPEGVSQYLRLSGVYFAKSSLEALIEPDVANRAERPNKGGRPRKEWWDDLWCAVWGNIVHGELTPTNQADIEKAMLDWVERRGETVAESTVKPMARKVWLEWNREVKN